MTFRHPAAGTHPAFATPRYGSTALRAPKLAPLPLAQGPVELSGPRFDTSVLYPHHDDMTRQSTAAPLGERIIVAGQVRDENGLPVPNTLVEIWQCNAAGRYHHPRDDHDAPLDPHFNGNSRVLTDAQGHWKITTIKPGAYPWRNHPNAWRPAHIHFSVFGSSMLQRLITQMYFPGDPLLGDDPIFNSIPNDKVKERLVSRFDWSLTQPEWALGYRFDIVLRGDEATPAN